MNSMIANIANTSAVAALAIGGYTYIQSLSSKIDRFSEELEKSEIMLDKYRSLKEELSDLEISLLKLKNDIPEISKQSASEIVSKSTAESNVRIENIERKIAELNSNLPDGIEILPKSNCATTGESVVLSQNSYFTDCKTSYRISHSGRNAAYLYFTINGGEKIRLKQGQAAKLNESTCSLFVAKFLEDRAVEVIVDC